MEIEYDISFCLDAPVGLEELAEFLAATEADAGPAAYEVLARPADFNPDSPDARRLLADYPQLQFLKKLGSDPNFPTRYRLLNQALAAARGRYLAPWAVEVRPLAGCLAALVEFLDEETETALAAPRLVDNQGRTVPGRRRLPGLPLLLLLHTPLGFSGLGGPLLRRHYYAELPPVLTFAPAEFLSDRALLIRRAALEELGFFDEGFRRRYADADYCRRAAALGWHCHYLAAAVAREKEPEQHRADLILRRSQAGHLADATRYLLKKWLRL